MDSQLLLTLLLALTVGLLWPVGLLFALIVTNVDKLQESYAIGGFTVSQVFSLMFVMCSLVRLLRRPSAVADLNLNMSLGVIFVLLGVVIVPLLTQLSGQEKFIMSSLTRVLLLAGIWIEVQSLPNLRTAVIAIQVLGLLLAGSIILAYFQPGLALWQSSVIYQHRGQYARVMGFDRDPNYAALKLLMAIPFFLAGLTSRKPNLVIAISSLFGIAVTSIGVLMTGSRAGLLTMIVMSGIWIAFMIPRGSRARRLALAVLGVLALEAVLGIALWASIIERTLMEGTTVSSLYTSEVNKRWHLVFDGLTAFSRSPVVGHGLLRPGFHNSYVDFLAEVGLIGFASVFSLIGYVVFAQLSAMRATRWFGDVRGIHVAVVLSIFAWGLMSTTLGAGRELLLWVALGLGLATLGDKLRTAEDEAYEKK